MARRFRVSIAGLLWAVAVAGLWMASLRSATVVWVTLAATATVGLLLTAVLGAWLLAPGPRRAFWRGFALFGWVYLVLVSWDWVGGPVGHDLTGGLRDLAERVIPPDPTPVTVPAVGGFGQPGGTVRPTPGGGPAPGVGSVVGFGFFEAAQQRELKIGNFVEIGRMALCLVFASAGGYTAVWMTSDDEGEARG